MKKQTMKTKLTLNKFKVAKIGNYGKSKIFGGTGSPVDDGTLTDDDDDEPLKPNTTAFCKIK